MESERELSLGKDLKERKVICESATQIPSGSLSSEKNAAGKKMKRV
jgi:hypothetical protein